MDNASWRPLVTNRCGRRPPEKLAVLPYSSPPTESTDLRLPSGDLLLKVLLNLALTFNCEDQCEGGRYSRRQHYYSGVAMVRFGEVRARRQNTKQNTLNLYSLHLST